jgi:hypothetical protein
MEICNKRDLRLAYEMLFLMQSLVNQGINIDYNLTGLKVIELKKSIRKYHKRKPQIQSHIVKNYGMDGYVELVEIPDVSDPYAWFDDNMVMKYIPSPYDCTGQSFTYWYKIFKRNGKWIAYHRVAVDC